MYIFVVWKEGSGFLNIGSLPCTCKCMLPSAGGSESHFSGLVVGVCYRRYHCGMKKSYKNILSLFKDMQVLQTENDLNCVF